MRRCQSVFLFLTKIALWLISTSHTEIHWINNPYFHDLPQDVIMLSMGEMEFPLFSQSFAYIYIYSYTIYQWNLNCHNFWSIASNNFNYEYFVAWNLPSILERTLIEKRLLANILTTYFAVEKRSIFNDKVIRYVSARTDLHINALFENCMDLGLYIDYLLQIADCHSLLSFYYSWKLEGCWNCDTCKYCLLPPYQCQC